MQISKEAIKARNILVVLFAIMFFSDVFTVYLSQEVTGAIRLVLTLVIMNFVVWGSKIAKIIFTILIVIGGIFGFFVAYKLNTSSNNIIVALIAIYSLYVLSVAYYMNFNSNMKRYFEEIKKQKI